MGGFRSYWSETGLYEVVVPLYGIIAKQLRLSGKGTQYGIKRIIAWT